MTSQKKTQTTTNSKRFDYYNWQKTLSYDSEVTMVVTARGRGKTYGIRKQAIKESLYKDCTFVEICRYKNELSGVARGYFDKLQADGEFNDWVFRVEGGEAYAAHRDADEAPDEKKKRTWIKIGYFVCLSDQQALKKHTFARVKRIIFDEVILDVNDRYHRYLPNEFDTFTNLIDTITRQRPGEKTIARVYLLGNSVDLINPYFRRFGIKKAPAYGYTWYNNKHFLLHYESADEWGDARREDTLVGHMLTEEEGKRSLYNSFNLDEKFVERKPSEARFDFGIVYNGETYGFWSDYSRGYIYLTRKIPKNGLTYALSLSDQDIDFMVLDRTSKRMKATAELAKHGLLRYEDVGVMQNFKEVLSLYGLT